MLYAAYSDGAHVRVERPPNADVSLRAENARSPAAPAPSRGSSANSAETVVVINRRDATNEAAAGECAPSAAAAPALARVKVLFPLPLDKPYDYLVPDEWGPLTPGRFVRATFGPRRLVGVVWPSAAPPADVDAAKVKPIERVLDTPALQPDVLAFADWAARYTATPLGAVLRLIIRSGADADAPAPIAAYHAPAAPPSSLKLTAARKSALAAAAQLGAASAKEIASAGGVSDAVVRGLIKAGALEARFLDPDPPFDPPRLDAAPPDLSEDQARAAAALIAGLDRGGAILLDGVTGAGKTETYLEAVAEALKREPAAQALIMLPEIALTLPFLKRIEARFGAAPAAWHSGLPPAARRRVWRRALSGEARIVVGARSALFLPYARLRLIVVDEEHDAAYKQEDGVLYHARDLAVARAARGGFATILVSATPSLETVVNVDQGRYDLARLRARYGGAGLPDVDLIDMRRDGPKADAANSAANGAAKRAASHDANGEGARAEAQAAWLAPRLIAAVNEAAAAGEQALLFLNRRGYAPLTLCRKCGHRMQAPDSDTWLVEHRFENKLICHHTGFSMPKPAACPKCKAPGALTACGPGVERVAEEAARLWPSARLAALSSDIGAEGPDAARAVLDRMARGEIDILVATQVVAKGHHFPNLTLVGVVDADMGLAGGDLRAAERTYQLLSQVAGRAGRAAGKPGRALLQTYQPDAPVLQALKSGDRDAFLAAEAAGRERQGFPPYGRLAAVILRSKNEAALKETAARMKATLFSANGLVVWGPAPAPIYRLRGEMRMRFLVKARRDVNVQAFLAEWLARVKPPASVRRTVDIDPYTFL